MSFVIPVLNGQKHIGRCLRSIRNLKGSEGDYEVLIVDNGSTDHTHQIMHDLGFAFHVIPNVHVGALRNRGASMAQGEYLAFVDSDVELSQTWMTNSVAVLNDRAVVAAGCFPNIPPEATWVQRTWNAHQRRYQRKALPSPVPWLPSMNLIVRRDDFLAVGGFNERLVTAEDVDLCYRLGQRGQILCSPAMDAIHWGEAPDLSVFWRKEVWHGLGNLQGIQSHGLRLDELPSLGYPLYVIGVVVLLGLGGFLDLWHRQWAYTPWCLIVLTLPALLLALHTARVARCLASIPQLLLLYLIYGFARAYAVVRAFTPVRGKHGRGTS